MATASLASLLKGIYSTVLPAVDSPLTDSGPWRPPQWGKAASLTMAASDPVTGVQTFYVFDAVIRAEHEQRVVITQNPVQTSASVTDHAYVVPATLSIEIRMSDAMQAYYLVQWNAGPTKSIAAYQTLIALQQQCQPVQVATPLRTYHNMMITSVRAEESKDTANALNATISFGQILTPSSSIGASTSQPISAVPQITGQSLSGQIQAIPVPSLLFSQNNILNAPGTVSAVIASLPIMPLAGVWSSTNVSFIGSVFG